MKIGKTKLLIPVKEQHRMNTVLNVMPKSDWYINEYTKCEEWLQEYYKLVAEKLDCEVKDLVLIVTHPDWKDEDEEGYNIESFFPKGTEIKKTILFEDLIVGEGDDMTDMGEVCLLEVNGRKLIVDYNASPCTMYIKRNDIW